MPCSPSHTFEPSFHESRKIVEKKAAESLVWQFPLAFGRTLHCPCVFSAHTCLLCYADKPLELRYLKEEGCRSHTTISIRAMRRPTRLDFSKAASAALKYALLCFSQLSYNTLGIGAEFEGSTRAGPMSSNSPPVHKPRLPAGRQGPAGNSTTLKTKRSFPGCLMGELWRSRRVGERTRDRQRGE